jgi:hypothetical protein
MNPNRTVAFAPHKTFNKALQPSLALPILRRLPTTVNCIPNLTPFRLFRSDPNTIIATLQLLAAAIPTAPKEADESRSHPLKMNATKQLLQHRQPMIRFLGKRTTPSSQLHSQVFAILAFANS